MLVAVLGHACGDGVIQHRTRQFVHIGSHRDVRDHGHGLRIQLFRCGCTRILEFASARLGGQLYLLGREQIGKDRLLVVGTL